MENQTGRTSASNNTRKLSSHFSANFCLFHTFLINSLIIFSFQTSFEIF